MPKPDYDTTIARMAGNIAAALVTNLEGLEPYSPVHHEESVAEQAVSLARAIVAEVKRTQPVPFGLPPAPMHPRHPYDVEGSEYLPETCSHEREHRSLICRECALIGIRRLTAPSRLAAPEGRVRELAMAEARRVHGEATNRGGKAGNGHTSGLWILCPHPDCVLVREAAPIAEPPATGISARGASATPCAHGHVWSYQYGDDWTPDVDTPCDCRKRVWRGRDQPSAPSTSAAEPPASGIYPRGHGPKP